MKVPKTIALIALVVLAVLAAAALVLLNNRRPEPTFEGKSLKSWLAQLDYSYRPSDIQASNAVFQMGTNILPFLRPMFHAHDAGMKLALVRLLSKQHLVTVSFTTAEEKRRRSARACRVLGPAAIGWLPEITAMLDSPDPGSAWCGLVAVSVLKPNSDCLPEWTKALTNQFAQVRAGAASRLAGLGFSADPATPLLLAGLQDGAPEVRMSCISALARVSRNPGAIIPKLISCLDDPSAEVRSCAALRLSGLGANALAAIPKLTERLQDQDSFVRLAAQETLKKLQATEPHASPGRSP